MNWHVLKGDALQLLREVPDNSCDALVCDPPAGIEFMGKEWDTFKEGKRSKAWATCNTTGGEGFGGFGRALRPAFHTQGRGERDAFVAVMRDIFREAHRALKPGAHALVWAIPRTSHWTAWALEEAGFEVRDVIDHLFGQGMPKSHDVSKAIDRAAGAEREVVGKTTRVVGPSQSRGYCDTNTFREANWETSNNLTAPATDEAKQWDGWGTALKPAHEHWILARKPLVGTVAKNVLAHSTGGLNIDGCRVERAEGDVPGWHKSGANGSEGYQGEDTFKIREMTSEEIQARCGDKGRWPPNVLLSGEAIAAVDQQSGVTKSGQPRAERGTGGIWKEGDGVPCGPQYGDSGGASRYFPCFGYDCWLCDGGRGACLVEPTEGGDDQCQPDSAKSAVIPTNQEEKHHGFALGDAPEFCDSRPDLVNGANSPSRPRKEEADFAASRAPQNGRRDSEGSGAEREVPVGLAENLSRTSPETCGSTAHGTVQTESLDRLSHRVSSAGDLCPRCGMSIARSLAPIAQGRSILNLGLDYTDDYRRSILTQSLAFFAEPWVRSGTIPTTESLSILFGYVRHAITASIEKDSDGALSGHPSFRYQSKPSRAEREAGLEALPLATLNRVNPGGLEKEPRFAPIQVKNNHPTVKGLALMSWLCRLITPPGGIVLDPFCGSGTTGAACMLEGFRFLGIEQDPHFVAISRERIRYWEEVVARGGSLKCPAGPSSSQSPKDE